MSLFKNLFGKHKESVPQPSKAQVTFPYEIIIVPGEEAVSACLRLRQEGAGVFTPVILGDPDDVEGLLVDQDANEESSPQKIIELSEKISMSSFVDKRMAEDEEFYENVEVGEWPENVRPAEDLTGHSDIVSGQPLKKVVICKVPTPHSWEIPAYLAYGGWNDCPYPEEQVAIFRYWNEKYGADIITVVNDVIECTVSRPPVSREQALELAREQFIYCSDIVNQGTETLSALAASLQGGKTWFFWWD